MNVPKSTESHLLLKNSSTRNIQQVFVTWKSLKIAMMAMKTKGFMIRICDEMKMKNFLVRCYNYLLWALAAIHRCG